MKANKRLNLQRIEAITLGLTLVFLIALLATSPSLAKPSSFSSPAQVASETTTINSTLTTTSITSTSLTTSTTTPLTVTTVTSLTTSVFTASTYGSYGGGGIPGFPIEGILLGFVIGAIALAMLRRRRST